LPNFDYLQRSFAYVTGGLGQKWALYAPRMTERETATANHANDT